MSTARTPDGLRESPKSARSPQSAQKRSPEREAEPTSDPTGQSPDDPIEFASDDAVGRGNEERANAEPEPQALHSAEVPGKPDVAKRRREVAKRES